jgi:tRNA1Val (adenine37-N6)-methyltransferase
MSNTYFKFKKFTIHQDKCSFKVTTDTCLLGAYANILQPGRICDIGTGSGILSLMMAQKFPGALIDAVEIDPLSARQARENVDASLWKERISVYNESIQSFAKTATQKYDMVISNPPYFEDHLRSHDPRKSLARHNLRLSFIELAEIVDYFLTNNGRFYTILPPDPFQRLNETLQIRGFRLNDQLEIYNSPEKPLYRIIGGFNRQKSWLSRTRLFIYDGEKEYTQEFKILLRDYYLAF